MFLVLKGKTFEGEMKNKIIITQVGGAGRKSHASPLVNIKVSFNLL